MLEHIEIQKHGSRNLQLVDVRSAGEFAAGHVPGAVNIPMDQIESRLADLNPALSIVLLCQSGSRSAMCAKLLASHGVECRQMRGGTSAWRAAGLPLVQTAASGWALERQVRFTAGLLVLAGMLTYTMAGSVLGLWFSGLIGFALTTALLGICPMGSLLTRMPWNHRALK